MQALIISHKINFFLELDEFHLKRKAVIPLPIKTNPFTSKKGKI